MKYENIMCKPGTRIAVMIMLVFLFSNANAQLITSSVTPIHLANTVIYVDSTGRILEPVVGWTSHYSICEFEGNGYLYFDN